MVLNEAFGPEWVAVYADDAKQRAERIAVLDEKGIRYVVWTDDRQGTAIVLDRIHCPADWEYP
jgi:malic enzyme